MSKEINNLNKPLKDQLDLNKKQDKTDNNLVTTDKTIVGAINELFQSANNGKQLIASAIGEPLNSEDTFSAMSNDINGLLSTFKTNMMNNGITVESSDRFKALIDKIATLADSEGKGIQYVTGQGTPTSTRPFIDVIGGSVNLYCLQVNNLTFKPSIILLGYSDPTYGDYTTFYSEELASDRVTLVNTKRDNNTLGTLDNIVKSSSCTINSTGFILPVSMARNYTWIAIGVGEEDTTLRDSLASILQEEGVNVSEEDDMASLISKVDEELTKDNNIINNLTNELAGKVTPVGTAVASNVLTGKTFINSTGQTITGTMANNGTKTITPKASAQTLGAGYYDKITINGDADLVAANIVSGKNIFGVTGSATITSMGGRKVVTGTSSFSLKDGKGSDITVSGLPFKPSIIVIMGTANNNAYVGGFYVSDITPDYAFSAHRAIGGSSASAVLSTVGANTSDTYYVVNGGFRLRVTASSINGHTGNVTWYAFE